MLLKKLPVPPHFPKAATNANRRLHYQRNPAFAAWDPPKGEPGLLEKAADWRLAMKLTPARDDKFRLLVLGIDYADTFGHPNAELAVPGAPADSWRFGNFIYEYLHVITDTMLTFDTHRLPHIFHTIMWRNRVTKKHPDPMTAITVDNVGDFEPSEFAPYWIGKDRRYLEVYLQHYVHELAKARTFRIKGQDRLRPRAPLVLWPIHAQLGSVGYTLFPEVEEAVVFHQFARGGRLIDQVKGLDRLTEAYSPFGSEVTKDQNGDPVGRDSEEIIAKILEYDMIVIGGEAGSHCVPAGIYDVLGRVLTKNPALARKIYVLKDAMSPVPGFEAQALEAATDFVDAGMNLVSTTTPMEQWQGDAVQKLLAS